MMQMTEDNIRLLLDHLQTDFDIEQLYKITLVHAEPTKDINDFTIKELVGLGFIAGAHFTMRNLLLVDADEVDPETLDELTKGHKTAPTSTTDIKKRQF